MNTRNPFLCLKSLHFLYQRPSENGDNRIEIMVKSPYEFSRKLYKNL